MIRNLLLVVVAGLLLVACGGVPQEVDKKDAQAFADKMAYAKDNRTGLCYGFVASSSVNLAGSNLVCVSTTLVPCDAVKGLLANK